MSESTKIPEPLHGAGRVPPDAGLYASEGRYRRLFEAAKDGILILDADSGRIVDVNPFLMELTGYSHEEFLGKHLWETGPFKDVAASMGSFSRLQTEEHVRFEDLPLRARDGRKIAVDFISNIYRADDESVIQCNVRDITARKHAEARHSELEAQLLGAQKMEAIGRLAGGVAHDFNNLLSVIISYAEFAIDQLRESDPVRSDLVEIHKAGQRAAALTRQLLAFGRKQMLAPEVLSLNDVVTDIESMLSRLLGEDVDVVTHLAEDLGNVTADRGQIEQVIMNLAVNSRDAMPEGGKLTIETANVELDESYAARHVAVVPGRYVLLSVSDTGCGMDAETQSRIFEPFFTTKERGKGTGIGLSTAYGIVKQSGGNTCVYSEPGQGTAFKVYLPRVSAPVVEAAPKPVSEAPRGSETVLVVEDEDAVRRLTERILRAAGYRVLAASNGGEALLLCEKHGDAIDLLLTDVVMPQMGGRELFARLATISPGLRVLFTSGYTDDTIVHHGLLAPGTRFIGKPFNAAALARKVREVLDET